MNKLLISLLLLTILIICCFLNNNKIEFFYNKKYGTEHIDGCVYINLENRKDRKKLLVKELQKMKIPIRKIHKVAGIYIPPIIIEMF